jgi:hypothetical protein
MTGSPPHTIMALPVHTAVWLNRTSGADTVLVGSQVSEAGV